MTTPIEILGALVVVITLLRSMWLLTHTTHHAQALSASYWTHALERASRRTSVAAKGPVSR